MCRNIKQLFNFDPQASDEEIKASALQFVRKVSGQTKPSAHNQVPMDKAVEDISVIVRELLDSLQTTAAPKNREEEAAKRKAANAKRFAQ